MLPEVEHSLEENQLLQDQTNLIYTRCHELFSLATSKFSHLLNQETSMLNFQTFHLEPTPWSILRGANKIEEDFKKAQHKFGVTINVMRPSLEQLPIFEFRQAIGPGFGLDFYQKETFGVLMEQWPNIYPQPFSRLTVGFDKSHIDKSVSGYLTWGHLVKVKKPSEIVCLLPKYLRTSMMRQLLGGPEDKFTQLTDYLVLGAPTTVSKINFKNALFDFDTKLEVLKTFNETLSETPVSVGYWVNADPPGYEIVKVN